MPAEIHVGDVGTAVRLHLIDQDGRDMDVSTATLIELTFVSPTNRRLVVPGVSVGTGVDGRVQYVVGELDLDVAGPWRVQAWVEVGAGRWRSNVVRFQVMTNL